VKHHEVEHQHHDFVTEPIETQWGQVHGHGFVHGRLLVGLRVCVPDAMPMEEATAHWDSLHLWAHEQVANGGIAVSGGVVVRQCACEGGEMPESWFLRSIMYARMAGKSEYRGIGAMGLQNVRAAGVEWIEMAVGASHVKDWFR
jgi:hypothetical protein